jgi:hypothetical protein
MAMTLVFFLGFSLLHNWAYLIGLVDWSGKIQDNRIVHMAIRFFWMYYDGNYSSLMFDLCGNMDLLWCKTTRKVWWLWQFGKLHCTNEQFCNLQLYWQVFLTNVNVNLLVCFQQHQLVNKVNNNLVSI